jgi:predicted transglutaminase-like cysteine proteinase
MISRAKLFRIHSEVNECEYRSDEEVYGVPEKWADILTAPGRKGDCEDTMIGKAHRLLRDAGWPVEMLRFATYWTQPDQQGYHAVLLVDVVTDDGICTYMLSNGLPFPLVAADIPAGWVPHMYQIAGTSRWEYA